MTTTIVIGEGMPPKKLMPIVFQRALNNVRSIGSSNAVTEAGSRPNRYEYIELICKDYQQGCDLMFAYYDPFKRQEGILYIGKWNDGVVE